MEHLESASWIMNRLAKRRLNVFYKKKKSVWIVFWFFSFLLVINVTYYYRSWCNSCPKVILLIKCTVIVSQKVETSLSSELATARSNYLSFPYGWACTIAVINDGNDRTIVSVTSTINKNIALVFLFLQFYYSIFKYNFF